MRVTLLLVLYQTFNVSAQQPAARVPVKQEVPDNLSEYTAPAQPLPYSHKTHIAAGIHCAQCHTNPDPGNAMTFPATSICMTCHSTIAKDKTAILKLAEYAKSVQPI